jgi:hypothetical protein
MKIKNKIYISKIEYLTNGIDLREYNNIKSIKIIDPLHKEFMLINAEIYFECEEKDLICIVLEY